MLDALMVPRDMRAVVLACGLIGSAVFGFGTILAAGDPIGWAYVALAVVCYPFLQTRLVPTFLWLLVAAAGGLLAGTGNPSGWIELGVGLALAAVAVIPVRSPQRQSPQVSEPPAAPIPTDPSPIAEESPIRISTDAEVSLPAPQSLAVGRTLSLRSLGQLRLRVDGVDLALEPRLQFLLAYLLARRVLGDTSPDRAALADEVAPGFDSGTQRERLRKQLHELQILAPAMSAAVVADRKNVSLDLNGIQFDVDRLMEAARRLLPENEMVDGDRADQIREILQTTDAEFLSGFEQLEHHITRGKGAAADTVHSARLVIANVRADLVMAYAEHEVASGHGDRCIALLTAALERSPDRQDLARVLVAAYLQTGQTRLATQARREYDLFEEK